MRNHSRAGFGTVLVILSLVAVAAVSCAPAAPASPAPTDTAAPPASVPAKAPTPAASPPTATPEPVTFPVCTDPEKVLNCSIPPEAILAGSAAQYYKTLEWPAFDESKLVFRKLVRFVTPDYDEIRYDPGTKPNYPDPATQPYQRLAFGWTQYDKYTYGLSFVRYYVKGLAPKDYPWIVGVMRVNANNFTIEERLIEGLKIYTTEMNFPVYADSDKFLLGGESSPAKDPFMSKVFTRHPDMQERIDAFVSGDPGQLDAMALQSLYQAMADVPSGLNK